MSHVSPDGEREGEREGERAERSVAVVVPVYRGERTLDALTAEIEPLTKGTATPSGVRFRVSEVLYVHDSGPDRSDETILRLAKRHAFVRAIWLSRNFGQHAATLAGMASTTADWVVTMDEDGLHDPRDIGKLLDVALSSRSQLVYAQPTNTPPHGFLRNAGSRFAKVFFVSVLGNRAMGRFNSFRLVRGEVARGVAAYCGESVYLDVALSWVVGRSAHCPIALRQERGRPSGYDFRRLIGHFWQLVLTSGTRPLRLVSMLGALVMVGGIALSLWVVWLKVTGGVPIQGWSSILVAVSLMSGLTLFSLGVIAEYVGVAVSMALGKPPYLILSGPSTSDRP